MAEPEDVDPPMEESEPKEEALEASETAAAVIPDEKASMDS